MFNSNNSLTSMRFWASAIVYGRTAQLRFLPVLLLLVCSVAGASPEGEEEPVNDEVPNIFVYLNEQENQAYLSEHSDSLSALREQSPIADISFVRLAIDIIEAKVPVNLNLPGQPESVLDVVRIEQGMSNSEGWGWVGSSSNREKLWDKVILTIVGADAYGSAQTYLDNLELYRVQPFNGDLHLLIRVDQSRLPEDHEPDYEETLNDTVDHETQDTPTSPTSIQDCSKYKVIMAYTERAGQEIYSSYSQWYPTLDKDSLIRQIFDNTIMETNDSYLNGGIDIRAELVNVYEATGYKEEKTMKDDLDHFCTPNDHKLDEVHNLRNKEKADVAVLVTKNRAGCGRAAKIGANASTAFTVVARDCLAGTGAYTFGHEIGHLQGARHNPEADATNSPFAYGHGYLPERIEQRVWRTIMAYWKWNDENQCPLGCPRLNSWSDPHVIAPHPGVALPMGVVGVHNNTRVLKETVCSIASWR